MINMGIKIFNTSQVYRIFRLKNKEVVRQLIHSSITSTLSLMDKKNCHEIAVDLIHK